MTRRYRLGLYTLDANNRPVRCDDASLGEILEDRNRVTVAQTGNASLSVSTVFLGVDHRFGFGSGPPMLFETMVFGGQHDGEQRRYVSWDDAAIGHDAMVRKVFGKLRV